MPMKLPHLNIALLVTSLALCANLHAADPTNPPAKAAAATEPAWERHLREVNWDSLPLGEIVKILREQFREINFVVARNVEAASVSLVLRDVRLEDLFKA